MTPPRPLTVSDVLTLRESVRWRVSDPPNEAPAVPWICFTGDTFALHAYGHTMAASGDLGLLATLLRQERAEPGFIRRVLDTREPPDVATLDPAGRAEWAARAREEQRKIDAYAAEQAALAKRRADVMDVTKLSLDDLI